MNIQKYLSGLSQSVQTLHQCFIFSNVNKGEYFEKRGNQGANIPPGINHISYKNFCLIPIVNKTCGCGNKQYRYPTKPLLNVALFKQKNIYQRNPSSYTGKYKIYKNKVTFVIVGNINTVVILGKIGPHQLYKGEIQKQGERHYCQQQKNGLNTLYHAVNFISLNLCPQT